MIKPLVGRVVEMLMAFIRREHWWAEFWSGVVAVLWGKIDWFSPRNSVTMPVYSSLHLLMSHITADILMVGFGLLQIIMLVLLRRWGRFVAAFGMCALYLIITLSILDAGGGMATPAVALSVGYAGINIFALVRLTRGLL